MSFWKKVVVFCLGGGAYVGLELLWRGRSHISMFFAGGTGLTLIGWMNQKCRQLTLPLRILAGAGIITGVEFLTGILANRDYRVWDYRNQPGNLMGHICPAFCLLWLPVSWLAICLHDRINKMLRV